MNFKNNLPTVKDWIGYFLSTISAIVAILVAQKLSTTHPDYSIFIKLTKIEIPLYAIIVFGFSMWLVRKIYLWWKVSNSELKIIKATYGKDRKTIDITDYLNSQIQDNKLNVPVRNEVFGEDPIVRANKEAVVKYKYKGEVDQKVFPEYGDIVLPS